MLGELFADVRRFPSIDSTNRYLLDEARAGAPEGVVAIADHQTSGRGRLGRRWEAPAGTNLLASVLLRPDLRAEQRHLASAVVCLAGRQAAEEVAGVTLAIKWPNDLLAPDGRKVAGILAEADLPEVTGTGADPGSKVGGQDRTRPALVVGIGMNVNWPATDADLPAELVGTACSLRQLAGRAIDRSALLDALLSSLEPRVSELATPTGRGRQAGEFERACSTVGTRVRVELPGESFEGTAVGLTEEGHLVVEVGGKLRTVIAGDVVHLRAGTE
jgi:BirA family transcriptional regulator, biotin operon repressor / biotin---[acetyl-CoA-carboxylase] ligase